MFFALTLLAGVASAQPVDSVRFFTDEGAIQLSLSTDIRKLQTEKKLDIYQPAMVTLVFPGGDSIKEEITVAARGHFRRENCYIPPLRLNFRNPGSPRLNNLGKLKMVIGCGTGKDDDQLVLKEYLIYKIYNLLEEKSFRVRLLHVNYTDTRGKVKPFAQHAFLIEDDKDMAKRNGCMMSDQVLTSSKYTDRDLLTKVAIFQYMISNGDWGINPTTVHNLKLICSPETPTSPPYAVPYDFDHSGFVNASYATPAEQLGTQSVTERVYRGYPRTLEELERVFAVFHSKKSAIINLISSFHLLKERERQGLVKYIEEFYQIIDDRRQVQDIFINNTQLK